MEGRVRGGVIRRNKKGGENSKSIISFDNTFDQYRKIIKKTKVEFPKKRIYLRENSQVKG